MKLKAISIATLTAMYSAGIYAAVSDSGWQKVDLTADQAAQRSKADAQRKMQFDALNPGHLHTSVNRRMKPKTAEDKFTTEPGLDGEYVYIIQLKDSPVATYMGGVKNIPATALGSHSQQGRTTTKIKSSANSAKLFTNSVASKRHVEQYRNHLFEQQREFVQEAIKLGVPLVVEREFTVTLNAITAKLTQDQAKALAKSQSVTKIQRSVLHKLNTDVGPQLIKADKAWDGSADVNGTPFKGEGQIIGIIDTGVNTDHIAFQDLGETDKTHYNHVNPLGKGNYLGGCAEEEFAERCNDKLIGVYTWDVISDMYSAEEFQPGYPDHNKWNTVQVRPKFGEDYNGHGSHTASTAAGNAHEAHLQIPSFESFEALGGSGDGKNTGLTRQVSGVAPNANIISYQACKAGGGGDPYVGCPTEATVASIEQAVLDGVDVINYSISGYGFPWDDAVEQAFYAAYAAGVSIAASAGNGGFGNATNHNSPWLLNVAATHHGRHFLTEDKAIGNFEGGDTTAPENMWGSGINRTGITGYLVDAATLGNKSCDDIFAPASFTEDQIVLCERSDMPRMAKAENVLAAGAGGFVLYNKDAWGDYGTLVTDVYPLPSIHISQRNGQSILDWMATGSDHKATITAGKAYADIVPEEQNLIANFTSAKENPTFDGTLTPSIAAPGVQIIAAWADDQPFTASPSPMDWNVIDGTSMSSPHVAGALALIRQAHPEWTASQVQSAAQMTATNNLHDGVNGDDRYFRGGAGMINVEAAIKSGLIMDETPENMLLANPRNGGNPTMLNLPALVNTACETECTWMRTVTATKDGTWTVEGKANHDEISIDIQANPSSFSLKAGESKTIFVTAKILDAVTNNSSPELSYLFGDVKLTPADAETPAAHWPVKLRFNRNDLPQILNIEAHRDSGQYTIKDLPVEYLAELNGTVFKASDATQEAITLQQDKDTVSPYWDGDIERTKIVWLDVPAGTTRLFAETIKNISSTAPQYNEGDLDIMIGYDENGNDGIDFKDETICWSYSSTQLDYCSISEPMPGKYWIVFNNYKGSWDQQYQDSTFEDTYEVAYGVVSDQEADNLEISTNTEISAGTQTVDVDIKWNISDWQQGDRLYSMIHLGSSAGNTSNIGTIPLNIVRSHNDVNPTASQTRAKAGDVLDINLSVLANLTGDDRVFDLQAELPEGVSLVEGSVSVDNVNYTSSEIEVVDNKIIITGNQLNSSDWPRRYNVTTNETDEMCRNPLGGVNGYVDLQEVNSSFQPYIGGTYRENHTFKFRDFWQDEDHTFAPFENEEHMPYRSVTVSPMGYLSFDGGPLFWADHFPMASEYLAFGGRPDTMIAPMMRGSQFDGIFLNTPLIPGNPWDPNPEAQGMTVLYNDNPKAVIVEWDNARTQTPSWDPVVGESWQDWGDSYDFQVYANVEYQYGDNQYEIVMAYDNLKFNETTPHPLMFAGANDASIGMYGFWGPRGTFGPDLGGIGHQFHLGDMTDALKDDLLVCYDYTGPEATTFNVSFKVQVNNDATGTDLDFVVTSHVEGVEPEQQTLTINAPANIELLSSYDDIALAEGAERSVTGLEVKFYDQAPSATVISVTGDNIVATVHGHDSGATFDIAPASNFYGTTEVTVTVADADFPSDSASTSFMLTAEGTAPKPTVPDVVEPAKRKSSGSLAWLLAITSMILFGRRHKLVKRNGL